MNLIEILIDQIQYEAKYLDPDKDLIRDLCAIKLYCEEAIRTSLANERIEDPK